MGQEDKYSRLIAIPPSVAGRGVTTTSSTSTTTTTRVNSPIIPFGSIWYENSNISNAFNSKLYTSSIGAMDFSILNPYIHYQPPSAATVPVTINTSQLLEFAYTRFEVYQRQFRNSGPLQMSQLWPNFQIFTTTTPTPQPCPPCENTILTGSQPPYAVKCISCEGTIQPLIIEYT